jgi:hypothetical protein
MTIIILYIYIYIYIYIVALRTNDKRDLNGEKLQILSQEH